MFRNDLKLEFEWFLNSWNCKIKKDFNELAPLFKTSPRYNKYRHPINYFHKIYPHLPISISDLHKLDKTKFPLSVSQKLFLHKISELFSIKTQTDWKQLNIHNLLQYEGTPLFRLPIHTILKTHFPQFPWNSWKFPEKGEKRRLFLDGYLVHHFEAVATQRDLGEIQSLQFAQHAKGTTMMKYHNSSLQAIFRGSYPELVARVGVSVNDEWMQQRFFLDEMVRRHFGFLERSVNLEDVSYKHFLEPPGGLTVLLMHSGSPREAIHYVYPELPKPFKNEGSWKRRLVIDDFVMRYLEFVGRQEDIRELKASFVAQFPGGSTVVTLCQGSLVELFRLVYPELTIVHGQRVYRNYWNHLIKDFDLINKIMKFYQIKERKDWERLSTDQFSTIYGREVNKKSILKLLEFWNPEEYWDAKIFSEKVKKRSRQKFLGLKLKEIFKDELIYEEYLFKSEDNLYFVFDFYIPGLGLVVEYQGEQHYFNFISWKPYEDQRRRDQEKESLCLLNKLILINVPYWWDNSLSSLKEIIASNTNSINLN